MSFPVVPKFSDLAAVAVGWVIVVIGTAILAATDALDVIPVIAVTAGGSLVSYLTIGVVRRRSISRLDDAVASIREGDRLDLSRGIAPGVDRSFRTVAETMDGLTYALNTIMLDITTASRKFSLFSSDIFFS
jgi:hypothetical protein